MSFALYRLSILESVQCVHMGSNDYVLHCPLRTDFITQILWSCFSEFLLRKDHFVVEKQLATCVSLRGYQLCPRFMLPLSPQVRWISTESEIPHEKKSLKKCDASAIHSSSQVNTKPNIPTEQLASRSRTQSSPNLLILTDHDD
ncbi:hypothetical protein WUBG_01085 [Wuchereria bancrofti]|uniref:Uncharacterized protein n=1 Tax=Wuchereria bancrofti TaxID=6293 RepID=J9EZE7_WUCBA|nr:hypothetical protein WUBG_01085 [Wuchereria bancrofti]